MITGVNSITIDVAFVVLDANAAHCEGGSARLVVGPSLCRQTLRMPKSGNQTIRIFPYTRSHWSVSSCHSHSFISYKAASLLFVIALPWLTVMVSYFKGYSPSASMPSSTAGPSLSSMHIPSFFNLTSGPAATWLYTTGAVLLTLLVLEQSIYRQKKQHLPGAKWTIPLIGKFADSMKPTMEGYKKQWDSGALSAISVFNM